MAKTLDEAGVKRLIQEIKGANKNLNTPIPISTENTPESKAQNVTNIADYVEKAKVAGIANVDGMGATCLINGGISGLGYIYVAGNSFELIGMTMWDDMVDNAFFIVSEGEFNSRKIAFEGTVDTVTSDMLVEGARNPIIITGDMTEVDEETYQKLLQEGTDVILSLGDGNGSFIGLQGIFNMGDTLNLLFGYYQFDESDNGVIVTYTLTINTSAPHTLTFAVTGTCNPVPKSELTPVLQEIDLTGTDAERKAKLDQFAADWKALTGADDLTGARFVGKFGITEDVERIVTGIMTYCAGDKPLEKNDNCFYGICNGYSFSEQKSQIAVKVSCTDGSLTITPLFSHLEAITIYTDNTPEHKQANLDNIAAYEANLQALGVDITKGWNAPVKVNAINGNRLGIFASTEENTNTPYTIISGLAGEYPYITQINKTSGASTTWEILCDGRNYARITTTAKSIIPAINEVNALVEKKADKSLNAKSIEAITIKTENTPDDKAANVAAIQAYIDNLIALGVDVAKGFMIPVNFNNNLRGFIAQGGNGNYVGYNATNNLFGGGFIVINSDGTYTSLGLLTVGAYNNLTTTSKYIVSAINEVNALAKGKADKSLNAKSLEAITIRTGNTPENKAANKAAIEAYRDNLIALGVDVTKGYMIPIKIKNGNGFILFDGTVGEGYFKVNNDCYGISISANYDITTTTLMSTLSNYNSLQTTSKRVLFAINEVNALAKGYSTIFTPIELTAETAQNKTAIDARVAAFTAQGISLTNGCCIPVVYKGVYAGNINLINGDWYGLLVKNTNNPADNINIKLSADGTITEGNSAQ